VYRPRRSYPTSGGCWVSHISYRREPSDVLLSLRFHHRLRPRRSEYATSMENAKRRFYVLKLPSLKRGSEHFENFTSSNSARRDVAAMELHINDGLK